MAIMTDTERARTLAQFMRDIREDFALTKPQLRAALDAIDDYFNTNAAAINSAIPQPARANLSAAQKATLIGYVAFRRAGRLKAEEDG